MLRQALLLASAALVLAAPPLAGAADPDKIDHPIRKEPAYQSKDPKYCLALFGRQAEAKVWLVLDGDLLYVDRNGNGDLTEPGEQLRIATTDRDPAAFSEVEIAAGGVKAKLSGHAWGWLNRKKDPQEKVEITLDATLEDGTRFVAWGDEKSPLAFADRPAAAPVVHFGGPLTLGLEIRKPLKRKGDDAFELNLAVGCRGRGPGSFAAMIYTPVPKDAYPRVQFEFPGKTSQSPPVRVELVVRDRC